MPSVESIKLLKIIEAKMGQNGMPVGQNASFLLDYLRSNKIAFVRVKGSSDKELSENTYTDSLMKLDSNSKNTFDWIWK